MSTLVDAYTRDLEHPYNYTQIIESARSLLGWRVMGPLVRKAWAQRARVEGDTEERIGFYVDLGTFAGRAGLHELALEIWKIGTALPGGEQFLCNQAVELSQLGRHAEALEIANQMPMTNPRSFTVLGNVRRDAGQRLASVDAYRRALEHDDRFLLPISNAIDCIAEMRRPDLLPPFVSALDEHWTHDVEASFLKGRSLLLSGRPNDAADAYSEVISRNGHVLDPDEISAARGKEEDLTVWGSFGTGHHKAFGTALIRAGRHEEFENLFKAVLSWPKWIDGDWRVLLAESHRRRGNLESAETVLEGMDPQPPPLITLSLCHLERGNFEQARKFAEEALNDSRGADHFNHIEGRPDAVGLAIPAMTLIEDGKNGEAIEQAKSAVSRDVGCAIARTAWASGLLADGNIEDAIQILREGIERAPGQPAMVRMAVETLLERGDVDDADDLLRKQRDLLRGCGMPGLAEGLGEWIALAKLERSGKKAVNISNNEYTWLALLDEKSRTWVTNALSIRSSGLHLGEAYTLYLSKAAERELRPTAIDRRGYQGIDSR